MKITQGQVHDAARALADMLDPSRPMTIPQTGRYRIAKMQRQLEPHYALIEHQRTTLVQKYGSEQFRDAEKTLSLGWQVDQQGPHFSDYVREWNAVREETIEIPGLQTLPLASLGDLSDDARGISVMEFRLLGELVVDTFSEPDAKMSAAENPLTLV